MGKKSSDTKGAARVQGQMDKETAREANYAERGNASTPWGSTTYTPRTVTDPSTGETYTTWDQEQSFTAPVQGLYDLELGGMLDRQRASRGMMGRALDAYRTPADFDQFGDPIEFQATRVSADEMGPASQFDPATYTAMGFDPASQMQAAEDAFYSKQTARLDPQFERQQQALETQLANQGLTPGDRAYDAAMSSFMNGRNDAYEQARLGSVEGGMGMFQQMLAGAQFADDMNFRETQYNNDMGFMNNRYNNEMAREAMRFNSDNRFRADQYNNDLAMRQADYANALRNQRIDEYINRRNFNLNEAERLAEGQGASDLIAASGG